MPRTKRNNHIGPNPTIVDLLAAPKPVESEEETPELEAEMPELLEPVVESRPVPESELTPEQRRIRELEDLLARERGRKDPVEEYDSVESNGQNILIHFVDDGFTALGKVWYRGQELEIEPGSQSYKDTCDRLGRTWLSLRDDESEQIERYGRVMFRSGPWPGKSYVAAADVNYEPLRPLSGSTNLSPSLDDLARAEKLETQRRRAAPRLPMR